MFKDNNAFASFSVESGRPIAWFTDPAGNTLAVQETA